MSFEDHRAGLFHLAYGMLGSVASAEDLVQDAWIRYQAATGIENEGPWLRTVVSRLALDELKSARVRRESYVGPWLPEPIPTDAEDPAVLAEALSLATLSVLEQLSAAERAAFLLREVFDFDYEEIANLLERTQPAVRQLVKRSKAHLAEHRPRFEPARDAHLLLLAALGHATQTGDLEGLKALLADDAVFVSDGGGKALAALKPVRGATAVARLLIGLTQKFHTGGTFEPQVFNGQPGLRLSNEGVLDSAIVFCIAAGRVTAIYSIRNPDKLDRLR